MIGIPGRAIHPGAIVCPCCDAELTAGTDVCPRCNTDLQDGPRCRDATVSLVFGLIGISVFPLLCSIPAIVLAHRARRELRANPGLHGREAAGWGLALGWAGCLIGVALIATSLAGALVR